MYTTVTTRLTTVVSISKRRKIKIMNEDLLDYLVRLLSLLFPTNAWIVACLSGDNHLIQIDWKLGNDSHQSSKRSRKIQIIISEEAVEGYLNHNKQDRELSDNRLKKLIFERYDRFNPDHDAHTIKSVPTEKWLISKKELNT
jgi:hypothetical protein